MANQCRALVTVVVGHVPFPGQATHKTEHHISWAKVASIALAIVINGSDNQSVLEAIIPPLPTGKRHARNDMQLELAHHWS